MLFIDFSSAFNTIIPQQLINKLSRLGLNNSLCNWILDFLTGRPQSVRVGHNTSSTTTLSTGAPQGCVLSPLLFTLLTHDCTAKFSSNHIIKFADDTSVVGLISNNDETHYREEVAQLAEWCGANNLSLNVEKTKEVVMDFRRNSVDHPPLTIDTSTVERVSSTKFLGVHITEDLTWTTNTKYQYTGVSEPAPPDCSTAFSPRLWEPWTQITPPLSETPNNPPPTLPHLRKKLLNFYFCAIQVSGPAQATCSNTLSSTCTRHFHTPLCVHNPTKDWL